MNKNILEINLYLSYFTGNNKILKDGRKLEGCYMCIENSYKITTDTKEGKEVLDIIKNVFPLNKVYFGYMGHSSAGLLYNEFKKVFEKCKYFKKMLVDMNAEYLEKTENLFEVCIAFKPLNKGENVDYGWTSIEQYLNGEIGVRPNDR